MTKEKLTAEEFIRNKIREKYYIPAEVITNGLATYTINAEEALRWAHEFAAQEVAAIEARIPTNVEILRKFNEDFGTLKFPVKRNKWRSIMWTVDIFRSRMENG